jgi:hypothetical protein
VNFTVPGIVEASVTISPEADGRISFRVLIGADSGQTSGCDLIELIIRPEDIRRALAEAKISASADSEIPDEPPAFLCHIGLHRNAHARYDADHLATGTVAAAADQPGADRPEPG